MCGPPLGGLLYQYLGFEYTFFINGGLLILPTLFALLWLPPDKQTSGKESKVIHFSEVRNKKKNHVLICQLMGYKWIWLGLLAPLLPCASWGLLDTTLELHLAPFHLSPFYGNFIYSLIHLPPDYGRDPGPLKTMLMSLPYMEAESDTCLSCGLDCWQIEVTSN